jgi:hypothetical protein
MPATPSRPATPWRPIAPWRPATPWRERGPVRAADWPAAREAARLLTYLGADTVPASSSSPALMQGGRSVPGASTTVDQDWAASGAAALTGWPDAPPVAPAGQPATVARAVALAFELITGVAVDGPALLGERAALMGLARNGRTAPGGATRLMSAADGWWALNLARDLDLVPALLETGDVDSINLAEPWCSITAWASRRRVTTIIERATLLGLAVAALGETGLDGPPWRITHRLARTPGRPRPLVANLGALWAGPLAAQLLRRSGADVIDIESRTRRDPTRTTAPEFYATLHAGHRLELLDVADPTALAALLRSADIVIEASRPRALRNLGLDAEAVLADGHARTWLRITGHRDPHRIAFGDDAAVAGALVAWDEHHQPVFAGDAIADPLTGLLAALAVVAHHNPASSTIIDIALADAAAYSATPRRAPNKNP